MAEHEVTPEDRALREAQLSGGAERMLAGDEPDGPVGLPLGILAEHLDALVGIDEEAFQRELEQFLTERPFVTMEDALRAVLRRFGVRAKVIPPHLDIVEWHEEGWQLVGIDPGTVGRSWPI